MMPIGTDPVTAGSAQPIAGTPNGLGRDAFLNLLITQLQHQDPLNPTDSAEFTAQLATFSSLEQLENVNDNIKLLQGFQAAGNNAQAVALIGKEITARGNSIELVQDQPAGCKIELDDDASIVAVSIYDHTGAFVNSFESRDLEAGRHTLFWDGKDQNGNPAPAGNYTFEVLAADAEGEKIDTTTFFSAKTERVIFEDEKTYLISGGHRVALSDLVEIRAAEIAENIK